MCYFVDHELDKGLFWVEQGLEHKIIVTTDLYICSIGIR